MNQIHWTGEVSLGHVLMIVAMVVSLFGAYWRVRGRLDLLTLSIEHLAASHNSHDTRIRQLEERRWSGQERRRQRS